MRIRIRVHIAPCRQRQVPFLAGRRIRSALNVFDGSLVNRHQTKAGTGFDGHIAHRHSALHRHTGNRRARILDGISGPASRSDFTDDRQDNVLRGHTISEFTFDIDPHLFGFFLPDGLRRQDMFDFGRTDPECDTTERAIRRSMRIAANHNKTRQGDALLRSHDVHNAVAIVGEVEMHDTKVLRMSFQLLHRNSHHIFGNFLHFRDRRRYAVIRHREILFRFSNRAALRR